MARRISKHTRPPRPLGSSHPHAETKSDGRWIVRPVAGATATKVYRCPECLTSIPEGTAHIVAWPDTPSLGSDRAVDDRRHWHSGCWQRRS
ncbi:MAG: hypothetical protein LBG99_04025 [Propionibacteriaceae bacterium]|nr:hypothetical protein [Propionibacteriaceae bacterium]